MLIFSKKGLKSSWNINLSIKRPRQVEHVSVFQVLFKSLTKSRSSVFKIFFRQDIKLRFLVMSMQKTQQSIFVLFCFFLVDAKYSTSKLRNSSDFICGDLYCVITTRE